MTVTLAALLCAAWVLETGWGVPLADGAGLQAASVTAGALWQPLTYAAVHASPGHLAVNLFVLLVTGSAFERLFGSRNLAGLFFLALPAGAVGFFLSLLVDPRLSPALHCVGASALATALFGAIATVAPRARVTLWLACIPVPFRAGLLIPLLALLFLAESLFFPTLTAYGAHLGGWTAGLLFGAALRRSGKWYTLCS